MVWAPTELDMQQIYTLNTTDDLPLGLIPSMTDHKIDHKYPKYLSVPILNTTYCIPRATVIDILYPFEIESTQVSSISWTTVEKL